MVDVKKKKKKEEEPKATPEPTPEPTPPPKPQAEEIGTFTDPKTGRTSGVTIGGKTFLGLGPADVRAIIEGQRAKQVTGEGIATVAEISKAKRTAEQAGATLEEAGAFEEAIPERRELSPEGTALEGLPFIGKSLAAAKAAREVRKGKFDSEDLFPVLEGETVREGVLREIRKRSFDEGITEDEEIGAFIEAIPLVGNRARAWAGGLTEDPSSNAEDVLNNINKIKEAASTGQEKVRNGLEDPDYGLGRARSMEEQLAKLEGRIQVLIITSAVLRAAADNVNTIEEQILEAKEKIARYRQASAFGLTAQLTGTGRIIPTDEQLFLELKESRKGK